MTRLIAVPSLLWVAAMVIDAACATSPLFDASPLPLPRPTPQATGLNARPTPAPTSKWTPSESEDTSQFARTEVFVMEKCCPYVSHFAVRDYPSAMEEDGWMPGLTFQAFRYNRLLPNCWQIVNATSTSGSQRWARIHRGSVTPFSSSTLLSTSDSFCLPTENRLPNKRVSVFYIEDADQSASFVSQPIRNASQGFFKAFSLGGWNTTASARPIFLRIYPLAYYYWRPLMPIPKRLISDVRLHAADADANTTHQCNDGYEVVDGNFNFNFATDPVAYFCVQYSHSAFVDRRFALSSQPNERFLTDITIVRKTSQEIVYRRRHPEYAATISDCSPPRELLSSQADFLTQPNGFNSQQLDALNETFAQLRLGTNYSVFTGNSEWLVFCMERQPLVQQNGDYRSASEFVDQLYLNLSQIVRRKRLGVVYNIDVSEDTKQSPFGRIHYDDEDAKEKAMDESENANAFDEL